MRKFILLLFICITALRLQGQDSSKIELQNFVSNINTFNYLNPQEKVYLHFDNTGYFGGETIFFKVYLVTTEQNKASKLSRLVYVELVSPEGDIIETRKIKIENGQGNGDLHLKTNIKPGYYEIRAYTRYMLNITNNIFFSRVFPIFKASVIEGDYHIVKLPLPDERNSQREKTLKDKNVNISFFPEGGNIIKNIQTKIAFKITGKNGENLHTTGGIYNKSNDQIVSFITLHNGMGVFDLKAGHDEYKAIVEYEGKRYSFDIPEILEEGYVLNVNNSDNEYMLIRLEKSTGINDGEIGILITNGGKAYAFEAIQINEEPFFLRIPKNKLPAGSILITVFDQEGSVIAERMAFNNKIEYIPVKIDKNENELAPFKKINMNIDICDMDGKPVETQFSLSVTDANTNIENGYTGNILTYLLLASDIKGYIEDPWFYFDKDDRNRRLFLDLLMMVQGWRRYDWQLMTGIKPFEPAHPIEKGILVEGTVLSVFGKKKRENIEVTKLITNDKNGFAVGNCMTDEEGRFNFLLDIEGTWNMTLQTKEKNKRKDYRVLLHRNFSPEPRSIEDSETNFQPVVSNIKNEKKEGEAEKQTVINFENPDIKSHLLDPVTITEDLHPVKADALKRASIIYDINEEIDKIRDEGEYESEDVWEFIARINPYFTYRYKGGMIPSDFLYKSKKVVFVINNYGSEGGRSAYSLSEISTSRIHSIIIVEDNNTSHRYLDIDDPQAMQNNYVTIFIYLNKDGEKRKENKGIRPSKLIGYSIPTEVYNPDYSSGVPENYPDFRRTLYWNPNVITDNNGKASVEFFNNKDCKDIKISAEGITTDGKFLLYME